MSELKVFIPEDVQQKLDLYIASTPGEISGLGLVELEEDGLYVTDVFLFEQICSSAETTLSEEDVSKFLLDLIEMNVDLSKVKLWWHSHATMGVFWSTTDNNTIGMFGNEWMLSVVGNKKGNWLARVDLYTPFEVTVHDIPIQVLRPVDVDLKSVIEAEVAAKVKVNRYVAPMNNYYPRWRQAQDDDLDKYRYGGKNDREFTDDWQPRFPPITGNIQDDDEIQFYGGL